MALFLIFTMCVCLKAASKAIRDFKVTLCVSLLESCSGRTFHLDESSWHRDGRVFAHRDSAPLPRVHPNTFKTQTWDVSDKVTSACWLKGILGGGRTASYETLKLVTQCDRMNSADKMEALMDSCTDTSLPVCASSGLQHYGPQRTKRTKNNPIVLLKVLLCIFEYQQFIYSVITTLICADVNCLRAEADFVLCNCGEKPNCDSNFEARKVDSVT